jgi:hypothetical protein
MNSSNNSLERVQIKEIISITQGEFPTFILSKNGKAITAWHNDRFGVSVMDEVDHYFK